MDTRKCLPQTGGAESTFSTTSGIQRERNGEIRQIIKEPGDSVATRVRKQEPSVVPCKVPRFQYVDFPSLHQCIKQLSVPPLEGWLTSCPLGKVPAHHPSNPKEKVPKFKYVDYPSLYHCIQQLSVPPLEIWSSKLTGPGELGVDTEGVKCPSQVLGDTTKNEVLEENRAEQQNKRKRGSGSRVHVPIPQPPVLRDTKDTQPYLASEKEKNFEGYSSTHQKHSGFKSEYVSRSGSGPTADLNRAEVKNEKTFRPSVISLVRTERQKHRLEPEKQPERCKSPASIKLVQQPIDLELASPITNPVEHQNHQSRHKDKGPQ